MEALRQRLGDNLDAAARGRQQRRRKQRVRFEQNRGSGRSLNSCGSGGLGREDSASNMEQPEP